MPKLKLFCSPKPDYYYFQEEIIQQVKAANNNWLAVMPVNRAVRIFSRKLVLHAPNKIISSPPVLAFDTILQNFYNQAPFSKTIISQNLMGFLIEEILKKLSSVVPKIYVIKIIDNKVA